ncbi:MAG: glycosyltransferase family 87 protein [Aquirufa sp.]
MNQSKYWYKNEKVLFILWMLAGVVTAIKQYSLGEINSHINNFIIFISSYGHFIQKVNLYELYPKEYFDLYLYGPIFSILIAPFAVLPTSVSLVFWNTLNALALFFAIWNLPLGIEKKSGILWIILNSLITALLNTQFHGLCVAMIIWSYVFLINDKVSWATLFIALGIFIKLYGVIGLAFFFFTKDKWKFVKYFIFWTLLILALPLLAGGWHYGIQCYIDWMHVLNHKNDINVDLANTRTDVCVMGMIRRITQIGDLSNLWFLIPSMMLNVWVFFQTSKWDNRIFQLRILAFMLLYLMLSSTGTESPTLIMAFPGVGLWFVLSKKSKIHWALLVFTLLISSFSPTDIFPKYLREHWINPYALMILPLFLVWCFLAYELRTEEEGIIIGK